MDQHSQTLMVQGTTSDAGKTTLVAGLCRVFARRGISVAPFKPQNMALNSAVTADGGEIGRSQALQAYACGLEPHTDMNPILLKPNSDTGAQVIVHGHALDNMEAAAYQRFKSKALNYAMSSYRRLSEQYDLIFVEGAGSPAEINLRENDVANMGFAEEADCPVVLVADIDRGGVFAHLVGTLALLSESEQNRVTGFVINRFRGDIKLLEGGLEWLEKETGKPVLAVMPYLHGLDIDQEDAIDSKQTMNDGNSTNTLKIKVPVFPRISNHTDFDVLRAHPQIDLEFVGPDVIGESPSGQTMLGQGADLSSADLIILPGSKSVQADLAWLKAQGLDKQIDKHLRYGGKLLGVCGGFQMLGESISDPHGIEGKAGNSSGLGHLQMETSLEKEKRLENISGQLSIGNRAAVNGYEIHCGISSGAALNAPLLKIDGREEGALSDDGQIAGTYIHGLFDSSEALIDLLSWAGLERPQKIDRSQLRDRSLNRLADSIEQHFDWDAFDRATSIALEPQEAQTG